LQRLAAALGFGKRIPWVVSVGGTFVLAAIGWLMFRERDFGQLMSDFSLSPFHLSKRDWAMGLYFSGLVGLYSLPLFIHMVFTGILPRWKIDFRLPGPAQFALETALGIVLFMGILTLRSLTTSEFIYFQF
jgi:hypothetical protein